MALEFVRVLCYMETTPMALEVVKGVQTSSPCWTCRKTSARASTI